MTIGLRSAYQIDIQGLYAGAAIGFTDGELENVISIGHMGWIYRWGQVGVVEENRAVGGHWIARIGYPQLRRDNL